MESKLKRFWTKHTSKEYRLYHHKIYLDFGFGKLYKDWKKSKEFLFERRKPKLKFYWGDCGNGIMVDYYMDIYASYKDFLNKWFAFHIEELGYKCKWGNFVYTHRPEIVCVVFGKVLFTIRVTEPENVNEYEYWQRIVDFITSQKKD